jgi:hypothetical protein
MQMQVFTWWSVTQPYQCVSLLDLVGYCGTVAQALAFITEMSILLLAVK